MMTLICQSKGHAPFLILKHASIVKLEHKVSRGLLGEQPPSGDQLNCPGSNYTVGGGVSWVSKQL